MSDYHDHDGKFFFGFFMGGLLGALTIFFLGTKEGQKAKKILKAKGEDLLEEIDEKLDELSHKGEELAAQGDVMKEQVLEALADKKDEVTQMAVEKIDKTLSKLETLQQKGIESTEALRQKVSGFPTKKVS
jgi:gas vesicle protein